METVLKVDHLTKKFGGIVAVNDLCLTLEKGGIHALIGPNGAGKTTVINLITGVYTPNSGTINFQGHNITGKKPFEIARLGLRRTYQNIKVFGSLTIKENLMVGGQMATDAGLLRTIVDSKKFRQEEKILAERADEVLELINQKEFANLQTSAQPYGVQKVLELGIAMMSNPSLILLDEPAAGLNPSERATFIDMILKIRDMGVKFLLIEHNMDVIMSVSEKITVLNYGTVIANGAPKEIQNNDEVIRAYLGKRFKKNNAQEG